MTEAEFQAELIRSLTVGGYLCLKLDPGTGNIPKGWPDLCVLSQGGHVVWCEVKGIGGTVSPQQRRHMTLLSRFGHDVCFCDPTPERCHPTPMTPEEIHVYQPPQRYDR